MSDDRDVVIRSRLSSALIIRVPEHGANVLSGIGTKIIMQRGRVGGENLQRLTLALYMK